MTTASTSAPPQPLMINRTKCHTAADYAERKRINLRTLYRRIEAKEIPTIEIAGVTFIYE